MHTLNTKIQLTKKPDQNLYEQSLPPSTYLEKGTLSVD